MYGLQVWQTMGEWLWRWRRRWRRLGFLLASVANGMCFVANGARAFYEVALCWCHGAGRGWYERWYERPCSYQTLSFSLLLLLCLQLTWLDLHTSYIPYIAWFLPSKWYFPIGNKINGGIGNHLLLLVISDKIRVNISEYPGLFGLNNDGMSVKMHSSTSPSLNRDHPRARNKNRTKLSCLNRNNEKVLVHLRSVHLDSPPLSSPENLA